MFNITNYARFENIEFTAEDNLAELDEYDNVKQDLLYHAPIQLCNFTTEASSYLETATAEVLEPVDETFNYTCSYDFDVINNGVATEVDTLCD